MPLLSYFRYRVIAPNPHRLPAAICGNLRPPARRSTLWYSLVICAVIRPDPVMFVQSIVIDYLCSYLQI